MRFLAPDELASVDATVLDALHERSELLVACGSGAVRGLSAAALMMADYAVLDVHATLHLDGVGDQGSGRHGDTLRPLTPDSRSQTWSAVVHRIGRRALRLHIDGRTTLTAPEAHAAELIDELIDGDPREWLDRWLRGRSTLALDSAAMLIRNRGGDALERAEFARLFAIGEPQRGLRAFLSRRSNFV